MEIGAEIAAVTAGAIRVTGAAGDRGVAVASAVGPEVVVAANAVAQACPTPSIIRPGLKAKRDINRRRREFPKPLRWKRRHRSLV